MSRSFNRSSLILLLALSVTACSGGGGSSSVTPSVAGAPPATDSSASNATIQGTVTAISTKPDFHVVANVTGKGNVPIYSSYLTDAKIGDVVSATGYFNSLGNFQATSASIISGSGSATPAPAPPGGDGVAGAIKLFQIFDYSMTAAQSTSAARSDTAVWGAGVGSLGASANTWRAGNAGLTAIQYFVQPTDENPISNHNVQWFERNHPDWIVYDCDANNRPTHKVAYQPGLPKDVPLDIHNPDVIRYQIETAADFAISRGANAIGADQTLFFDYDGGQHPGWYGCGIYQNGTFVRRWGAGGSGFPNMDPQWNHDVAAWVATAKEILTTDPALAAHNIKLFVNHPAGNLANADEQKLIANVDGLVDETGFVDYGHYASVPSLFESALAYMEYVQRQGKTILETAKFSGSLVGDSRNNALTVSQLAYAMGSFLIGDQGRAALYITPGPYGRAYNFSQIATVNARLGTSCGSYSTVGDAYVRRFTHGMVVVNPGTRYASVPLGGAYSDVMGRPVRGATLTVNPADAYILLGPGGC